MSTDQSRRAGSEPRPVIFLAVGEPSGDLHGAGVARALRSQFPHARLLGLGGPLMAAEGVELLADLHDLAVMGFVEVLSRLPFFFKLRDRVFEALEREEVDLVIPIDYPGFNLRLARHARSIGIPVLYYIAPQVWAWNAKRTRALARDTDRVAVILPFEEDFLRDRGVRAEFVGHPLLDRIPAGPPDFSWAEAAGVSPEAPVLALFPGSRTQEVERHLELFCAAAERVRSERPDLQVVIGAAPGIPEEGYRSAPFPAVRESRALLRSASAALVKSGTGTLEAALAGTPFVVAYRMNGLTYSMAKRLVRVPHIALANLVADRRVVPEFVQDEATPENLARALLPLLEEKGPARRAMIAELAAVQGALGRGGAGERVAEIAVELLAGSQPG